jgi:hypothetical protein
VTDPATLSGRSFDSLHAMMLAHADEAGRIAAADHGMTLDFTPASVAPLETVLAARSPVPDPGLESATRLWGAYFGEILRRRYSGEWIMAVYPTQPGAVIAPDQEMAMPALDLAGSQVYPLLKIFRRLTLGPSEDLSAFYNKVSAALDARQS